MQPRKTTANSLRKRFIKLNLSEPKVSYLAYPRFDRDPHPPLRGALTVGLRSLRVRYRDYANSENPPILHRKELLIPSDDSRWDRFKRLTEQEEKHGLYATTSRIGTRNGWDKLLAEKALQVKGHRVVRKGI